MKLLVIGATGMIGSSVTEEALSRGHEVVAATRNPEKVEKSDGLSAQQLDVTNVARLKDLIENADVVIGAVSPRNTDNAHAEAMAYVSALIEALGTKRLLLVGGAGSLNLEDGTAVADVVPQEYAPEAKAMRAAYEHLAESDANYTVLAPAGEIEPGERTGQYRMGSRTFLVDAEGNSRISTQDYAIAMLNEIENPAHERQIFTVAY